MIIIFWLTILFAVIVVAGELTYRYFNLHKEYKMHCSIPQRYEDAIDMGMDSLTITIESVPDELIPTQRLAMRGSWRLAQNQIMNNTTFSMLKKDEYNKFL